MCLLERNTAFADVSRYTIAIHVYSLALGSSVFLMMTNYEVSNKSFLNTSGTLSLNRNLYHYRLIMNI